MSDKISQNDANATAFERLCATEPVLVDVARAADVVSGLPDTMILTSGPPIPWSGYTGGQRAAIVGAARYEGLADSDEEAVAKFERGELQVGSCHDFSCIGSLAGVYSPSMAVFVVRNAADGNLAYCNFYEGQNPRRLNYGVYDRGVHDRLKFIDETIAPVVGQAVREAGGIPLKPLMARALHMGDELHSRNTAASLLFGRALFPHLLKLARRDIPGVEETIELLTQDNYFFLRLSMAAAKAMADSAHNIPGSSLVTAMALNCNQFGIRVSGLGDEWFVGPQPEVQAKLFEGHSEDEITWMGGESMITETVGLGAFAQAASFPLQAYQGGSPEAMVERNLELYNIVHDENPHFRIPYLTYRGTPTAIDILKVLETGVTPLMDMGIAGRDGGQIGAGVVRARPDCFAAAARAYRSRYG